MQFHSDNAAQVHPRVGEAMRDADALNMGYDGGALTARLDEAMSALFGADCAVLWAATGTAANCLALAAMVRLEGGAICHREAHIEVDEGGAPGFLPHGAKLMLADVEHAKLAPDAVRALIDPIRDDVYQVQPRALSVTQASEYGCAYRPQESRALSGLCRERGLGFHIDGARFANAVAFVGCHPRAACEGADALSFGMVKNGAMNAEAIAFFDPGKADRIHHLRKRAGHLQSKGRFLAARILAMIDGDLRLDNARKANAAALQLACNAPDRLLRPVEANELFLRLSDAERAALREKGFGFHDWGHDAAWIVTAWDTREDHVEAFAAALAAL
ncbi:MAG: low specificity L-threonine aldolase [Alphaproteobacteria bacterium]|nr:low specificity L-threonine aldolase [Alphaproteobacteria bacterium]